ncbi:peptide ABC transporter substrate-binding protein [Bacillus canaveralius]|uniref:Peptide ABC transporter substrate-binding protein n=1 Tax=Bacillus canaveralius TaxID=1403243 RepID=A0A2N5GLL7_9BACI|nr:ABC transporter substrate-binding protein [Bacillus canaveralius]PLR82532.1 peptide ABC transporter substrate-binding protein [Bacillus canaveralius]PLR95703.1 peptide ABC transporter substrate-binding protein [Bacillus canaveralius]
MKKLIVVLTMWVLILSLAACSSDSSSSSRDEKAAVKKDKTLTIATGSDMVTFDIHDHNNTSTEAIHINLFNYLVKTAENGEFAPDLAESWENIDNTTWNFKLREGVKFHNGEDFTAEDVKFTLERVAKDNTLLEYGNYKQIKEVKIISDYEFSIITETPEPAMLNRLSRLGSGILPSQYIQEEGWETFLEKPVGTGPYKFVEWKKDDRVVLESNPDYFAEKPKWEKLIFRAIPEDSTRVSELLTGGVDIATNIPPTDWNRIKDNEGTALAESPTQRVMMLTLRHDKNYPTSDPKVREAIDLAIDKQAILDNLMEGAGTVTRTRVTPGNNGANESLYNTSLYDPEKAKQLLKEAGYEDGLELTLSAPNGRYLKDKESVELMQAMLSEVGINLKLDLLEWSSFNEKYNSKSFEDMFLIGYGNSMFDAALAMDRLLFERAKGETDYNNPEVEKLLNEAMSNMNKEDRIKQYQRAQEIIAEDRPYIFLYQLDSIYGVHKGLSFKPRLDEMLIADDITLK